MGKFMGNIFKRKEQLDNNQHPKPCEYTSVTECPYSEPEACKFDKKNCFLEKELKNKKKPKRNTTQTLIITAISSLLIYVIAILISGIYDVAGLKYLYNIIFGVCLSVFAGSVLALFIDIPTRFQEYEESFINALSSNNYLKTLDEARLSSLRNEATEQLHKSKAPNIARGLINLDQRILDLLRRPYYTYYRHSVHCKVKEGGQFYIKEHLCEYKLINPYGENQRAIEFIKMRNLVLITDNDKEPIKELKISCQIDDGEVENIENKSCFTQEPKNGEFYNTELKLYEKDANGDPNSKYEGIKIEFKDNVKIRMSYNIKVSKSDPCFTKRLQYPAKNFRLDYRCSDPDTILYGQIFGTELNQSDISINYNNCSGSISLETFDWLLPKNGAIVVMLNNPKNT